MWNGKEVIWAKDVHANSARCFPFELWCCGSLGAVKCVDTGPPFRRSQSSCCMVPGNAQCGVGIPSCCFKVGLRYVSAAGIFFL